MSDTPAEPRRTWFPLVAAAAVAVLVIVGAVVATWLTSRMSPAHADAVRACEAAYAAAGDDAPGIVAGDVYGSSDWRGLRSFLEAQGILDSAGTEVTDAIAPSADASAAALAEAGRDRVTVVWWLESEEHLVCTVDVEGERAVDSSVTLGTLAESVPDAAAVAG